MTKLSRKKMKNKDGHTIKYHIFKFLMSCKGWWKSKMKLKKGGRYIGGAHNYPCIFRGGHTFYESKQGIEKTYGIVFFSNENVDYPYWQMGIFEWRPFGGEEVNITREEMLN